jgi:hypothetical protein
MRRDRGGRSECSMTKSAYDPETADLLRTVLDRAWNVPPPYCQMQIGSSHAANAC